MMNTITAEDLRSPPATAMLPCWMCAPLRSSNRPHPGHHPGGGILAWERLAARSSEDVNAVISGARFAWSPVASW